jgi:hypothetical protein
MFNFKMKLVFISTIIFLLTVNSVAQSTNSIQTPKEFFGFTPGEDGMLFTYEELISYLQILDEASPRLKLVEIGKTPLERPMYIAFISSEENVSNLNELQIINRELALNPNLDEEIREKYFSEGKVFVLGTLSMHSGEVGPSQAAALIAYDLATTNEPEKTDFLKNSVYMMVPCHNPDGMDMIIEHYKKYKDTKYDGSSMPGVYHKYVGHDNNRDFVTLTQEDTKAIARIYNKDWFPQVMVEKHQMGSTGPRYFVPPPHDPIAENIDAGIWNWIGIFGSNLITDMTGAGLKGVSQHYLFDDYWPGSTETCIWKNVIGFLTEAASSKYATPIYVEPNELIVRGKGLSEYEISINMPEPWAGGWWRLSDIVEYEIVSTISILETAAANRQEILRYRNDLCKKEVERGKTKAPYYYILPKQQHDKSEFIELINLLDEHGVEVYFLKNNVEINNRVFGDGDVVIPLAQPFRPFIKEVMEKQKYPVRHYTPDGEIIKPYDITSWSLPLHKGVTAVEINEKVTIPLSDLKKITTPFTIKMKPGFDPTAYLFSANNNESYKAAFIGIANGLNIERLTEQVEVNEEVIPAGSFLLSLETNDREAANNLVGKLNVDPIYLLDYSKIEVEKLEMPRIALVESNFHDMDAGWTRFIFDTYYIPYTVIKPGDFEKTDFVKNYDVVVIPNENKSILMEGKYKSGDTYYATSYPPEFTKGIGTEGFNNLMSFLDEGGIIISWGNSTDLFIGPLSIKHGEDDKEDFQLPVNDVSKKLKEDGLYVAGSLVNIKLTPENPVTYGMEEEIGVFFRGNPVFTTSLPRFDMDRRVIATFPKEDILLSGYAENEQKLKNKTAAVWIKKGNGQLVLFGFSPQFRGSTNVSFKLLFNSLLLKKIKP